MATESELIEAQYLTPGDTITDPNGNLTVVSVRQVYGTGHYTVVQVNDVPNDYTAEWAFDYDTLIGVIH